MQRKHTKIKQPVNGSSDFLWVLILEFFHHDTLIVDIATTQHHTALYMASIAFSDNLL